MLELLQLIWVSLVVVTASVKVNRLDPYYLQSVNTLVELQVSLNPNCSQFVTSHIVQYDKNDDEKICEEILYRLNRALESSYPVCQILSTVNNRNSQEVRVMLIVPHYLLFINNIYNNPADFMFLLKTLLELEPEVNDKCELVVLHSRIRQIGRIGSGVIITGSANCDGTLISCHNGTVMRKEYEFHVFATEACKQITLQLVAGSPKLENAIKGCWTFKPKHDSDRRIQQLVLVSWTMLCHDRLFINVEELASLLEDARMIGEEEYQPEVFNVSLISVQYMNDVFRVYFDGILLRNGQLMTWDTDFRLSSSELYKHFYHDIKEQLKMQLDKGNADMATTYKGITVTQIIRSDKKVEFHGQILISRPKLDELRYSRRDLAEILLVAQTLGSEIVPDTAITDLYFYDSSSKTKLIAFYPVYFLLLIYVQTLL